MEIPQLISAVTLNEVSNLKRAMHVLQMAYFSNPSLGVKVVTG